MKTNLLKSFLVLLTFTLYLLPSSFAQSPEKMSYQAVIRDEGGNLVTEQEIGMQISILQGSASGTTVYTETQTPTTNANGLVSIEIGGAAGFNTIDWANGIYFIKTETDPDGATGGISYTITGTSQLLSVPYALHSKTAENIIGGITETDPVFAAWDKSTDISITENQISDLGTYIESETDPVYTAWDKDYADLNNTPTTITIGQAAAIVDNTQSIQDTAAQIRSDIPDIRSLATQTALEDTASNIRSDFFSGDYSDLSNTPIAINDFTMDAGSENITNLSDPVNAQDAATKAYVDALLTRIESLEETNIIALGLTDPRDGTHYNVVEIGNQIWMAENLKYLPSVVDPTTTSSTIPWYCVYGYYGTVVDDAKATANYTTYGVLYNWAAAMNGATSSTDNPSGVQGICPTGWHLPSDAEWTELIDFLGGTSVAGGKLKEIGTSHWSDPNTGATNETGFTALPGGYLDGDTFIQIGDFGYWWSATEFTIYDVYSRIMVYNNSRISRDMKSKDRGFSVRCIRD